MKTVDVPIVVDDQYLQEQLNLSLAFIKRHSRAMGSLRCKPRRFLLKNVLAFIERRAEENASRPELKKAFQQERRNRILQLADRISLRVKMKNHS